MSTDKSHGSSQKRIAIMVGAGYIPGINAVVAGASLAAGKLGWELVGILDGLISPCGRVWSPPFFPT